MAHPCTILRPVCSSITRGSGEQLGSLPTMSCYLPLVQRWRKPDRIKIGKNVDTVEISAPLPQNGYMSEQSDCTHVHAMRDGKGVTLSQGLGDFPHQVFLNIRHDHPTLGLSDVAYQRLHQEHTHKTKPKSQKSDAGVVSLGLPLGISSLKIGSRRRKQKSNKRANDHNSDSEVRHSFQNHFYKTLSKSTATINEQDLNDRGLTDSTGPHHPYTYKASRQTKSHHHAARKSSLPRKAKIPSSYQLQPRPLSVDADLLLQSINKSSQTGSDTTFFAPCDGDRRAGSSDDILKYAHLTSPRSFMATHEGEKSSSGNSSGSDLTSEGSPHPDIDEQELIHPALRGRPQVSLVVANRGPPPRHLLPKKLKPSPLIKLHPLVVLPPHIRKELEANQVDDSSDAEICEMKLSSKQKQQYRGHSSTRNSPHRSRAGSPFGRSRHATPHGSQRRSKSQTPSPLDPGYQTLEHSYDGESSMSSDTTNNSHIHPGTRNQPSQSEQAKNLRLEPGVLVKQPRRGQCVMPCHLLKLTDSALTNILSFLSSENLARVSRTCRRLYQLSWQPELWCRITLSDDRIDTDRAIRAILGRLVWGSGKTMRGSQGAPKGAPGVQTVQLGGSSRLTDRSLALLARNCPELEQLELQRCRNVTNGGILDLVTRCTKLNYLDLTGCPMVSSINIVRKHTHLSLTHLDMSECSSLDDTGLNMIMLNCPLITHLYLRKCIGITDVGVRSIALYCPQVRELSLSDCTEVTDYGLCELAKLGPSLRYLSVSKCPKISDTGLRQLASHCYKIRYLNLRGCLSITDATVVSLSRSCTRLRSLDVGKCDVTDNGLRQLARQLPNIRKISVRGCQLVGDQGVVALARGCPGLIHLNIQDCEVSLQACKIVSSSCRNCFIETSIIAN